MWELHHWMPICPAHPSWCSGDLLQQYCQATAIKWYQPHTKSESRKALWWSAHQGSASNPGRESSSHFGQREGNLVCWKSNSQECKPLLTHPNRRRSSYPMQSSPASWDSATCCYEARYLQCANCSTHNRECHHPASRREAHSTLRGVNLACFPYLKYDRSKVSRTFNHFSQMQFNLFIVIDTLIHLELVWRRNPTALNRSRLTRQTHRCNRQMSKAKSAHYSKSIAQHSGDYGSLWKAFNKILHRCSKTHLPDHSSIAALANTFSSVFINKISVVRSPFPSEPSWYQEGSTEPKLCHRRWGAPSCPTDSMQVPWFRSNTC